MKKIKNIFLLVKTPKINFLNACPRNVILSWECVISSVAGCEEVNYPAAPLTPEAPGGPRHPLGPRVHCSAGPYQGTHSIEPSG